MLGASTKHYKTYGKHKTNVVNRRVVLSQPDLSSSIENEPTSVKIKVKSGGWSDSSSENESEDEVPVKPRALPKATVVRKAALPDKENRIAAPVRRFSLTITTKSRRSVDSVKAVEEPQKPCKAVAADLNRTPLRTKPVSGRSTPGTHPSLSKDDRPSSESEADAADHTDSPFSDSAEIHLEDDELASERSEEEDISDDASSPTLPSPFLTDLPFPEALNPLLSSSLHPDSTKPYDFTSFVSSPLPPFSVPSTERHPWIKVGEASYSEVFSTVSQSGEAMVVKIIPIAAIERNMEREQPDGDMPFLSEWNAVNREIEISKLLGGQDRRVDGFVRFKGAFLVQGSYPESLLAAWDRFKTSQKPACDDQIRPSSLPPSQLYALILLDHAGTDLESWKLRNWKEAREIWEQVVEQLGRAECELEFEHRDLHWGNILIAPATPPAQPALSDHFAALNLTPKKGTIATSPRRSPAVQATLIDFTLSRINRPASTAKPSRSRSKSKSVEPTVLFDGFEDDCIFDGHGDTQFDVYRGMREVVEREGRGWQGFHPKTNLLWLHYLIDKLLHSKKLKPPTLAPTTSATAYSFASPGRAVPSPRKTRRQSMLHSIVSSPLPPFERKARTLPSSAALLSKSQKAFSEQRRKEMLEEMQIWEQLRKSEQKLREVLGNLLDPKAPPNASRKATSGGKKTGRTAKKVAEPSSSDIQSAAEFAEWLSNE
ncbi:uncharacterized protein JCM15063_002621 [Sporobolomyces koalae]|uniref:uncharacterized protein n=1 Tax=Sporobolomyces koalae TaxID=500713 RepID=UPI00317C191F